MAFVLGISEGSWVDIGLAVVALLIPCMGVFLRYKAKSDKADIMVDIESKIAEEIEPIEKRMDKHDTDFKEFKRDEIEPMKKDIHDLITKQSVIDTKVDNVLTGISEIKELFKTVFDKIDKKQDKK